MARAEYPAYASCPCGSGRKYKFCCRGADASPGRGEVEGLVFLDDAMDLADRGRGEILSGRIDEGRRLLDHSVRLLPTLPMAHNNLALAAFLEGDIEQALAISRRVLREMDPSNVFALAAVIHYTLLRGETIDAAKMADALESLNPDNPSAAAKQCESLARLGRHSAVARVGLVAQGRWPASAEGAFLGFFTGTALANLGRHEEAAFHLRRAARDPDAAPLARTHLDFLEKGRKPATLFDDWPYFPPHGWLPLDQTERLEADSRSGLPRNFVPVVVGAFDADPAGAEHWIPLLAESPCDSAREVLWRIATGVLGPDGVRLAALRTLVERGELEPGEQVRAYIEGTWREVAIHGIQLAERAQYEQPPDLQALAEEATAHRKAGKVNEAVLLGRRHIALAPDDPVAHHNLAVFLIDRGEREEALPLLRRALDLDPAYLYARATLALQLLGTEDREEAEDLLRHVPEREAHPAACAYFLYAQAQLAVVQGDLRTAHRSAQVATEIDPENETIANFADRLALPGALAELVEEARVCREKRAAEHRQRLLPADPSLREAFGDTTRPTLRRILRNHGLSRISAEKKAALLDRLVALLSDASYVNGVLATLPQAERQAVEELHRAGGALPVVSFSRRHTGEAEAPSPLERLKGLGLIEEGVVGGTTAVFLPREVRLAYREPLQLA